MATRNNRISSTTTNNRKGNAKPSGSVKQSKASKVSKPSKSAATMQANVETMASAIKVISKASAAAIKASRGKAKADEYRSAARTLWRMVCTARKHGGGGGALGDSLSFALKRKLNVERLKPEAITIDNVASLTVDDVRGALSAPDSPAGIAAIAACAPLLPLLPKLAAAATALDGGKVVMGGESGSIPLSWALRSLVLNKPISGGMVRAAM